MTFRSSKPITVAGAVAYVLMCHAAAAQDSTVNDNKSAVDTGPAVAPGEYNQTENTGSVEQEVVVQGFRASLSKSLDIKQQAVGTVEAISSEDIGKFPDSNIAEALQRVPGVSIDRNGGEGRYITVRGFGPAFNQVLVNGRLVATESSGREFSFDVYPADMISGAEVYKSGVTHLQSGGIGATVNLTTTRPLDIPDRLTLSAAADYEEHRNKYTPDVLGLWSHRFADDTLGVLLGASFSRRLDQIDNINTVAWRQFKPATLPAGAITSNPGNVTTGIYPLDNQISRIYENRGRVNAQAAFQFRPQENLTFTLDGMFDKFNFESRQNQNEEFFNLANFTNVKMNPDGTVTHFDQSNGAYEIQAYDSFRPVTIKNVGFNTQWNISGEFTSSVDVSRSNAVSNAAPLNTKALAGARGPWTMDYPDGPAAPPIMSNIPYALIQDPANYRSHVFEPGNAGQDIDDTIYDAHLDNAWKPADSVLESLAFGVEYSRETKSVDTYDTPPQVYQIYAGEFEDIPDNALTPFHVNSFAPGVAGQLLPQFGLNNDVLYNYYTTAAGENLRDQILGLPIGTTAALLNSLGGFKATKQTNSYAVQEKIYSIYAEATFKGSAGPLPWSVVAGVRGIETKTTASGYAQQLLSLSKDAFDPTEYLYTVTPTAVVTRSHSYFNALPNVSLKLTPLKDALLPNDQLIFRISGSQSLTRPELNQIAPTLAFTLPRPGNLTGAGGNIDLKPFLSTNFDAGLEYYFGKINYLSAGFFYKRVKDFIVQTAVPTDVTISNTDNISEQFVHGNTATFLISEPTNSKVAKIHGAELSAQLALDFLPWPLDGFGVLGNVTFVQSNANAGAGSLTTNFTIPGLSNTQNATLFYSKGPVDARLAWSRRAKFLESYVIEPVFDLPYQQLDGRVSYDFRGPFGGAFEVFAQGTNLLNQKVRKVGRYDDQFVLYNDIGPRYAVGFRLDL